jgi:hypothetical protein
MSKLHTIRNIALAATLVTSIAAATSNAGTPQTSPAIVDLGSMLVTAERTDRVTDLGAMTVMSPRDGRVADLGALTVTAPRVVTVAAAHPAKRPIG